MMKLSPLLGLLCLWSLPLCAQTLSIAPVDTTPDAFTYTDTFETNQALSDAAYHSPWWPQNARSAVEAHLKYYLDKTGRQLEFVGGAGRAAYLAYRFPMDSTENRDMPVSGTLDVTLSPRLDVTSLSAASPVAYCAVSEDDRQWSQPHALTEGPHVIEIASATGHVSVLFWSRAARMSRIKVTLKHRTTTLNVPTDYVTIQGALNAAQDGDVVDVAPGVYRGAGNTNLDCLGKRITLRATAGPDKTVIDCGSSAATRGFVFRRNETRDCVIQGFTINQGSALTGRLPSSYNALISSRTVPLGGGILCVNSSPTLIRCVIQNSWAGLGGGLACVGGRPRLINCRIQDCHAMREATETSQWGGAGAALLYCRQANLLGCTFINNQITGQGQGAGLLVMSGHQTLKHCTLQGNATDHDGGGLYGSGAALSLVLQQCLIIRNTAANGAGVMLNSPDPGISAVQPSDTSPLPVSLINCTIADNRLSSHVLTATTGNGIAAYNHPIALENSIIWNSLPSLTLTHTTGTNAIRYNLVEGGADGIGNLDSDPLFTDPDTSDYHLQSQAGRYDPVSGQWRIDPAHSPAIDAGDPNHSLGLESEPMGNRINLGAFGGYKEASKSRPSFVFHVDAIDGSDHNTGLLKTQAFKTIQHAIHQTLDGDQILVWPAVYQEELDFLGKAITVEGVDGAAILTAPKGYAMSFYHGEQSDTVVRHLIITQSEYAAFCYLSSPTLEQVTVVDNDFGVYSDEGANPTIRNAIFWGNRLGDLLQCRATYSCIETPHQALGVGNLSQNPCFAAPLSLDFHLMSEQGRYNSDLSQWQTDDITSPCINAADPRDAVQAEPSPHGNRVNMGAYGQTDQASLSRSFAATDNAPKQVVPNPVAIGPVNRPLPEPHVATQATRPADDQTQDLTAFIRGDSNRDMNK